MPEESAPNQPSSDPSKKRGSLESTIPSSSMPPGERTRVVVSTVARDGEQGQDETSPPPRSPRRSPRRHQITDTQTVQPEEIIDVQEAPSPFQDKSFYNELFTFLVAKTLIKLRDVAKVLQVPYSNKKKNEPVSATFKALVLTHQSRISAFQFLASVYGEADTESFKRQVEKKERKLLDHRDADKECVGGRRKRGANSSSSRQVKRRLDDDINAPSSNAITTTNAVTTTNNAEGELTAPSTVLTVNEFARLFLFLRDDDELRADWIKSQESLTRLEMCNKTKQTDFRTSNAEVIFNSEAHLFHLFPEALGTIDLSPGPWRRTGEELMNEVVRFKKGFNELHNKYMTKTGSRSDDFVEFLREEGKNFEEVVVQKELIAAHLLRIDTDHPCNELIQIMSRYVSTDPTAGAGFDVCTGDENEFKKGVLKRRAKRNSRNSAGSKPLEQNLVKLTDAFTQYMSTTDTNNVIDKSLNKAEEDARALKLFKEAVENVPDDSDEKQELKEELKKESELHAKTLHEILRSRREARK